MHDLGGAQKPPARPQTVTPGSIRDPTPTTVTAFRDIPDAPPPSRAQPYPNPHPLRSGGRLCPPVLSLGEPWLPVALSLKSPHSTRASPCPPPQSVVAEGVSALPAALPQCPGHM